MKCFEGFTSIGDMNLKGITVEKSPNSLLVTANRRIYVPEKTIILMDPASKQETILLKNITKTKGGYIA